MVYFNGVQILFVFQVLFCVLGSETEDIQITRDYSLPAARDFKIYWNVPTYMCQKHNINFKPLTKKYGIISNPNDAFRGKEVNILYDPGLFPAVMKNSKGISMDRNGGIPQLGDINSHLEAFQSVVEEVVSSDLSGIGIIDFETWRPIFRQNWRDQVVYRNMSKDLERQHHPQWVEKKLKEQAKQHFEEAAREFMEKTLELAKLLRPNAKWGYYGFPYCYNFRVKGRPQCPDIVLRENNELSWLFKASTALFPSIYMTSKLNATEQVKFVIGRLNEAWRVSIQQSMRFFTPVYPYIWYKYYDSDSFLTQADIYTALEMTRRYKMGGAVIWGASNDVNTKAKCTALFDYVRTTLGPAITKAYRNENNVHDFGGRTYVESSNSLSESSPTSDEPDELEYENVAGFDTGTTTATATATEHVREARTPSPAEENLNSWLRLFKWFLPFPSLRRN